MSWPKLERLRRWLTLAVLLAVTPKCLLCLAGWLGLLTLLGLGPEICGASIELLAGPIAWFTMLSGAVGVATFLRWRRCLAVRGSFSDGQRDRCGRSPRSTGSLR